MPRQLTSALGVGAQSQVRDGAVSIRHGDGQQDQREHKILHVFIGLMRGLVVTLCVCLENTRTGLNESIQSHLSSKVAFESFPIKK